MEIAESWVNTVKALLKNIYTEDNGLRNELKSSFISWFDSIEALNHQLQKRTLVLKIFNFTSKTPK
jgi:hypothetical protein